MTKTKLPIRILLMVVLCMIMLVAGCEKDKNDPVTDSIIGKWKWIYSNGGFAGDTMYPKYGQTVTLEFTKDSILIGCENAETVFESKFSVLGDTLKYTQGAELECKIRISKNTLFLYYLNICDVYNPTYKRIK